jgi:3-methyladenine DNA glycosylase/8-oxoguanine DNA glycosylase
VARRCEDAVVRGALERRWRPDWPADLARTLGPLCRGAGDPTMEVGPDGVWRATRTPDGPATVHYARQGPDVVIRAWGPGAARELDEAPTVLGVDDDPSGFAADAHPVMRDAHRRFGAGWRVPRTGRVLEALVPAVLEQRVTGLEARRSWRALVLAAGEPAPGGPQRGGPPLHLPPTPAAWAGIPSWEWHAAGVDPGRAATAVRVARRAEAVERLSRRPADEAAAALTAIPGVGAWTAAEVAVRAWGDRDAVSFGDYHLARNLVHALTGRRDGTDDDLAALLAPWAGQRARAVRMLELHCGPMPRRGPRAAITDHRAW